MFVLLAMPLLSEGQSVKLTRLYVEPFTTKSEAKQLRDRVVAELGTDKSLTLVSSAANADAILDGGGEIWIKGYSSLNPRSGRLPSDGTPVYAGYLSVELRDSRGQTFWSNLVTPSPEAGNVAKDMAKRIAKSVAAAMRQGEPARFTVQPAEPSTVLKGAGATFPQPVYAKWFQNYRRENPNLEINYQAVGSQSGVAELLAGKVDFGASDSPEAMHDLAPEQQTRFLFLPTIVGAVVPIVNLPGMTENISLTPEALAGIYLGTITKWNDPVLTRVNKNLHLPNLDITVVHRADGSGTSYAFTDYLSRTVPEWQAKVGAHLNPAWPAGKAANGNDGVAKLVKELGGSIGYVEFIYALQNHLSFGKVRNRNGEFIDASLASIAVATDQAVKISDNFKVSIVDAPGQGAYPIASFTWLVIPVQKSADAKRKALQGFLEWMLGPGQTQAAALGYVALPKDLVVREQAAVKGL